MKKNLPSLIAAAAAFLAVWWPGPQPNEQPYVVVFSGLLAAFCAWALTQAVLGFLRRK